VQILHIAAIKIFFRRSGLRDDPAVCLGDITALSNGSGPAVQSHDP
jgi:hypothetical protein